ncbi:MAG: hypothetical protein DRO05_03150 [Thermoproteota archaeon]|nr:MAG: hypothetical protein DRO05_03150 [Candidatus Korarchaeota archaeon]
MKGIDSRNIVSGVGSSVMIAVIMRVAKKTFVLFLFKESRSIMPYFYKECEEYRHCEEYRRS